MDIYYKEIILALRELGDYAHRADLLKRINKSLDNYFLANVHGLRKAGLITGYYSLTKLGQTIAANGDFSEVDDLITRSLAEALAVNYWLYSPGKGAQKWEEFKEKGIMAIGFGDIGDLRLFASEAEVFEKIRYSEYFNRGNNFTGKQRANTLWIMLHEVRQGDVIYVRRGRDKIIGRGIITSDYYYDTERSDEFKHIRSARWTESREFFNPFYKANDMPFLKQIKSEEVEELSELFTRYTQISDWLWEDCSGLSVYSWPLICDDIRNGDNEDIKIVLACIQDFGETFTLKQLANKYGRSASYYYENFELLGKRSSMYRAYKTNAAYAYRDDGSIEYLSMLFFAKPSQNGQIEDYTMKLRPEVAIAFKNYDLSGVELYDNANNFESSEEITVTEPVNYPRNLILYGPPGTGKTYSTVIRAVAIIDGKPQEWIDDPNLDYSAVKTRYDELCAQNKIAFVTFHQSYGYEEFIEGIKPIVSSGDDGSEGDVKYHISDGVFKKFCIDAKNAAIMGSAREDYGFNPSPAIWKVSLDGSGPNRTREECMEHGYIRIGWPDYGESISEETVFDKDKGGKGVLNSFIYAMNIGDIVLSLWSASEIDAIGVITGEYEWDDQYPHFKRMRTVNWIVKGIRRNIVEMNGGKQMTLATVHRMPNMSVESVMQIIREELGRDDKTAACAEDRRVFIIDEINRGNISKIFGELITLIEESKRIGAEEEMKVCLPYSGKKFGVPSNIYLIGTMNTADRSLALLDTAIRRRFKFEELMPEPKLLNGVIIEGVNIERVLEIINKRLELLLDREHALGHSYFMPLLKPENQTMEYLSDIFSRDVVPMLKEYFYSDWEKIRLILGDGHKNKDEQFITKTSIEELENLLPLDELDDREAVYSVNSRAFSNPSAYIKIYASES